MWTSSARRLPGQCVGATNRSCTAPERDSANHAEAMTDIADQRSVRTDWASTLQSQKSVGRSTKVDWALTADRRHTAALICRALEASKS